MANAAEIENDTVRIMIGNKSLKYPEGKVKALTRKLLNIELTALQCVRRRQEKYKGSNSKQLLYKFIQGQFNVILMYDYNTVSK